jgi:hypothetical protein
MRAVFVIALLGLLLGRGLAQESTKPPAQEKPAAPRETTLSFAGEGERWWWTESAKGEPLSPPQKTSDPSVAIKLPPDADALWVYDAKTGNLAQLKVADLKEKTELTSDRFSHVARVQVNLQAQGKPVASAVVQLTDANGKTHTRVLEPSAEGILVFERVPLGKVSITARYGDEGKASQETTLKAERETRVPIIELALSGSVAALRGRAEGRGRAGRDGDAPGQPNRRDCDVRDCACAGSGRDRVSGALGDAEAAAIGRSDEQTRCGAAAADPCRAGEWDGNRAIRAADA